MSPNSLSRGEKSSDALLDWLLNYEWLEDPFGAHTLAIWNCRWGWGGRGMNALGSEWTFDLREIWTGRYIFLPSSWGKLSWNREVYTVFGKMIPWDHTISCNWHPQWPQWLVQWCIPSCLFSFLPWLILTPLGIHLLINWHISFFFKLFSRELGLR